MRTCAEPVFNDIVVTSLTTGKFNRLVNGERKFEEATGGVKLKWRRNLESLNPEISVTKTNE